MDSIETVQVADMLQRVGLSELELSEEPDIPHPFGYKCQWYAVRTDRLTELVDHFGLTGCRAANWASGLDGAYGGYYFVSPPVAGWTLVVNAFMPDFAEAGDRHPVQMTRELSARFGEACYFGTHRVVEYHAWVKAVNGQVVRAYGYVGEQGETIADIGEPTSEERELGLAFTSLDEEDAHWPSEDDVLEMAAAWTIDPQMGDQSDLGPGVGIIGDRRGNDN
ncbi:hypothetical protein [Paenibacillus methanolicus]|nr:hypothetical protein [Paenibacillus methanolicus]